MEIDPALVESNGLVSLFSQDLLPADLSEDRKVFLTRLNFCDVDLWKGNGDIPANRSIFLARAGEKYIGAYIIVDFNRDAKDWWSNRIWDSLSEHEPEFYEKAVANSRSILLPNGLVVDREWRKKGVYRQMMNNVIDTFSPAVILSPSKSPASVEARAIVTGERGYRTFFGLEEITPDYTQGEIPVVINTLRTYCRWINYDDIYRYNNMRTHTSRFIRFDSPEVSDLSIPDVSSSSPRIREVFRDVRALQRRTNRSGHPVSILKPLISVRADLL
jgi:GNAT superfamily N-acetyltransferase